MALFSAAAIAKINAASAKMKETVEPPKAIRTKTLTADLLSIKERVLDYFKDSDAILITTKEQLHDYVDKCIESGIIGVDTETTGLDRQKDYIVGTCLCYKDGPCAYIPHKHRVPIFENLFQNQLTYEDTAVELQRMVDAKVKSVFANADFDLWFLYKDLKVDFIPSFFYDVQIAWRCMKENEPDNALKVLYNKYVLKGKGDPMKFNDFFSPELFPYCEPEVAKLYAANDAKITLELYFWQLPYITKDNPKCKKHNFERIADLVWNLEMPLVPVCQQMQRDGMHFDQSTAQVLSARYGERLQKANDKLAQLVQDIIDNTTYTSSTKRPFASGKDFKESSPLHVRYLLYTMLNVPQGKSGQSTDKEKLKEINLPVTNQILEVRSLSKLIGTYIDKLPKTVGPDGNIHAQFKTYGADTGRLSSANPNLQNLPSHATDIRHMFRASPGHVLVGADYSQQEPKLCAAISNDPTMVKAFMEGKDIYATIASAAFKMPYESCLEFNPVTHDYQPDGKKRRTEAKSILLGVLYGRSVPSIAEQLYGGNKTMTTEQKTAEAQKVYDAVMGAFTGLRDFMLKSQQFAHDHGYVETIFGRRRHIPEMTLEPFEFKPLPGYVNPDIDPLNPATLANKDEIPAHVVKALQQEFSRYKYFGQIAKRTKDLYENHKIRVINNRAKINDGSRMVVNSRIQGSAADLTKSAMLLIYNNQELRELGGKIVNVIHDEVVIEVPAKNYKRAGEILSAMMEKAGSFLPFGIRCDVENSYRWYGLEYPCPFPQPKSWDYMTEDEVKWVQYHLFECEYVLPVFKDADGNKPEGIAAKGVNGVVSKEYEFAISDYCKKYQITKDEFFEHIHTKVDIGRVPQRKTVEDNR